ncbi:hypothetical protein ACGC1H_006008 [Rhizoctonia solani]|uniref:Uncharacterized protein n=1 Tax=Rhizoctonia solani TaxID=456999 RepID=A0A8H3GYX9_9AGAM|nr:unnamed protein product [Rhizoctonia solani]
MDYPFDDDDPVIWQCSQAVELKRIFKDAPVATAPPPSIPVSGPSSRATTGTGPHGVKRKRRQDQDTPATSSAETLGLIQQLSRTLGGRPSSSNLARRNTRIASTGNIIFGMPPPKPKPPSPDEARTSDSVRFNRSRSSTTSPLVIGKSILESSSDSNSTVTPRTPPNKSLLRPSTEPTISVSVLLDHARAESPELPPPPVPAKPIISIRTDSDTVDRLVFSTRSNTLESATSATGSGSFISTTGPISPPTPLAALPPRSESPETPILDLTEISPTPSPEPKAPPRPKSPPVEASVPQPPTKATRPAPKATRATTDPSPPNRPPVLSLQHTRSEPSQSFKPPTQAAFRPPTQQAFKPPTQTTFKPLPPVIRPTQQQQNPRTFPSSQSRLGLGALGKGYSGVNKPFKVPNKGKGTVPLTVVPLPKRDSGGTAKASTSPSKKKENFEAGRGKRGNSPAPAARPTTRATSGFSSRTTSGSSSRTSASSTRTTSSRTTTGKHTQSRRASGSKGEQGSDDSYIGSDEAYDAATVDADMAYWDAWDN